MAITRAMGISPNERMRMAKGIRIRHRSRLAGEFNDADFVSNTVFLPADMRNRQASSSR